MYIFFHWDWSWNHFCSHSLPTADSSRAVSYWRKDVHLVLVNLLGSLPRNSVVKLTDRLDMTIVVDWDVKPQNQTKYLSGQLGWAMEWWRWVVLCPWSIIIKNNSFTSNRSMTKWQGSPFIMLCLGSIELDCVISEPCHKEIILYRNYWKMAIWEPRPGRVITKTVL